MRSAPLARLLAAAAVLALAAIFGCAAAGLTPVATNQPIARQALLPEYRVFYDALADYGDWILIEPYGFVFRPRVAWNQWQPFEDGFWAATDAYGWVWISAEPFGWATYHYGQWLFDKFQGWVWTPGVNWTPGSVSWLLAGDYVGWEPLAARNASVASGGSAALPATAMHFAPIGRLGTTDLGTHLVTREQIGAALAEAQPIRNFARVEGLTINRGPTIELVEQRGGAVTRVRVDDVVPTDLGHRIAGRPSHGPMSTGEAVSDSAATAAREAIGAMQRAGEAAADEARRLANLTGASPPRTLPVLRPIFPAPAESPAPPPARRGAPGAKHAPADSTR